MTNEAPTARSGTLFLAGTIVSCPSADCGSGLYKVTRRTMTDDLLMDDGKLLSPLNFSILPLSIWTAILCQFCGASLYKDGKVHTLQYGWV